MIRHQDSHVDHVPDRVLEFVMQYFGGRDLPFIETIELPPHLPSIETALYGPSMGDTPVESDFKLRPRGKRTYNSRIVNKPTRFTRKLTVVAGPYDGRPCVLYTCYGGPVAPKEPNDPSILDSERRACEEFWSIHAIAIPLDPGRILGDYYSQSGARQTLIGIYENQAVIYVQCSEATAMALKVPFSNLKGIKEKYPPAKSSDGLTWVWTFERELCEGDPVRFIGPQYEHAIYQQIGCKGELIRRDGHGTQKPLTDDKGNFIGYGPKKELVTVKFFGEERPTILDIDRIALASDAPDWLGFFMSRITSVFHRYGSQLLKDGTTEFVDNRSRDANTIELFVDLCAQALAIE